MATMSHRGRHASGSRRDPLAQMLSLRDAAQRARRKTLQDGQPSGVMDDEERAVDAEEQSVGFSVLELTAHTVRRIENALLRLQTGEYGTCCECRGRIPDARLRALPFADLCLACQEGEDAAATAGASRSGRRGLVYQHPIGH